MTHPEGGHRHVSVGPGRGHDQLAFPSAALLDAMTLKSSFQDPTNAFAPSS
jgi:hypothetical protein